MYKVTFQETGSCGIIPIAYQAPWSVTLGNWTEVEPPNGPTYNLSANWSPVYVNYSAIVFSVPSGTYLYAVRPSDVLSPASGSLSVSRADLIVRISGPSFLCVGTTTTTTLTTESQLYNVTFQQTGACFPTCLRDTLVCDIGKQAPSRTAKHATPYRKRLLLHRGTRASRPLHNRLHRHP